MAKQGFSRNVVQDIKVPSVQVPDFAGNRSAVEDVADVASFGLQVFGNIQKQKKAEAVVAKKEGLAQAALDLNSTKLDMQSQGLSSIEQNARLEKKLAPFSAVDKIAIREMSAKDFMSGTTVTDAAEQEAKERNAEEKFTLDTNNSTANEIGFASYADMPEDTRDDTINSYLQEKAELTASDKKLERVMKGFQFTAANSAARKDGINTLTDNSITKINFSVRNGVRVGMAQLRQEKADGLIKTDDDMGKRYVELLSQGTVQLQEEFAIAVKGMPPEVQSSMESKFSGLIKKYEEWADVMQTTGGGKRNVDRISQKILNIDAQEKEAIYEVEGMGKIINLIDLGVQDASTLNFLDIANAVIGDQVKTIGKALKQSGAAGNISGWSSFYKDVDTSNLDNTAQAVRKVTKDIQDGKVVVEGGDDFVASNTVNYMNEVINTPSANQFRNQPLSNFTDTILHNNYSALPEAERKAIGDAAPAFARKFFGTNNTGAFVPSVNRMLEETGLKLPFDSKQGTPLWSLGVNKDTGMLEVSLAGTEQILKKFGKDEPSQLRLLSPSYIAGVNRNLKSFKQKLESNSSIRKVLQATAKATGNDLETVTHVVLSDLSLFSNIPVAEAFTRRQAEDPKPEPKVEPIPVPTPVNTDDMDDEEFAEFQKQQLEARGK